jgi:RNA polymerase sigma-70 factor (ECF subfamily)
MVGFRKLPEFEGRSKPSTWLVGICYRVASDRRRLAHVQRETGNDGAVLLQRDERPGPDEMAERGERVQLLDEILAYLRPEQREVFVMFELEELTGKEIAAVRESRARARRSRSRPKTIGHLCGLGRARHRRRI